MRNFLLILMLFLFACSPRENGTSLSSVISSGKWIDLTYDFSDNTLYWPNNPIGFRLDTLANGVTPAGFYYSSYAFFTPEHGGTHLDAPVHFAKGKLSVDQVTIDQLTGDAIVIDISKHVANNADYLCSIADLQAWEKKNGSIAEGAILLIRTGWGKYYPDANKYLGTAEKGSEAIAKLHFPGLDPQAAEWLVKNRKIKAIGIDTPSVDYGQSKDFKTHQVLYAQNICGFENLANLDQLPIKGAYIIALPMKIKGGSGGPLRIVAWRPLSGKGGT
jgi:kynurenine formamidase